MKSDGFEVPKPDLQISFHTQLEELRDKYLLDGLLAVVGRSDVDVIDRELRRLAPGRSLRRLAGRGLRGEIVFAVPYVLRQSPLLLGYYRLLLGFSQKEFYGKRWGFSLFRAMEADGRISTRAGEHLEAFCKVLCGAGALLLDGVPSLSRPTAHDLTLLTLGPQLRGGNLNVLGSRAARAVLEVIKGIVGPVVKETASTIELRNAAGRTVRIRIASDPDIAIQESLPSGQVRNLVAIEIKGGVDKSNVHNRIGEAEKSHLKAKQEGYVEHWTLVGVAALDDARARKQSPTTTQFFLIDQLADPRSEELQHFAEQVRARVGISD